MRKHYSVTDWQDVREYYERVSDECNGNDCVNFSSIDGCLLLEGFILGEPDDCPGMAPFTRDEPLISFTDKLLEANPFSQLNRLYNKLKSWLDLP